MKYLLLVIAILSLPCSAHAACTVENSFATNDGVVWVDLGQSWTAVCDGVLSSIKVSAIGAQAGPFTLSIFRGESVDPGDLLAQAPNIALADGENTIAIPTEVNVSNGQLYTFQFDDTVSLRWSGFIDDYPGGQLYWTGFDPRCDLWFEVEIVDKSTTGGTGGSNSGCFISTLVDH